MENSLLGFAGWQYGLQFTLYFTLDFRE